MVLAGLEEPVDTETVVDADEGEAPPEAADEESPSAIGLIVGICLCRPRYMANREPPPARTMTSSRLIVLQAAEGLTMPPVRREVEDKARHIL